MSAQVPKIESSSSFTGQTSALATTTIFTPAADGLYRVNIYMSVTAGMSIPSVTAHLKWTDNGGAAQNNNQIQAAGVSPCSAATQSLPIFAKSGTNITIETSGLSGSPTYDLLVSVESL
jgi:hypothetical protein